MIDRFLGRAAALVLATVAGPVLAGVVTFSGELDDAANTALVASDMSAARFSDDWDTANNVALYELHVAVGGTVNFNGVST